MELERTASTTSPPTVGEVLRRDAVPLAVAILAACALCFPTIRRLVAYWIDDPDFSHGFLIPVVSACLLAARRNSLAKLPAERSILGLVVLLSGLALYFLGYRTLTNTLERLGLWTIVAGGIWFALGGRLLRGSAFPLAYLLFAIPPPFLVLNPIRLALKEFATRLSADVLLLTGVSAMPEGNVLVAEGHRLEVADACSGIRSLMAIVATAVLIAYLFRTGWFRGILVALTAVPVTIVVNVVRIVVVAFALSRFEVNLSDGWPHDVLGFAVFGLSLLLLFSTVRFYDWFFRVRTRSPSEALS